MHQIGTTQAPIYIDVKWMSINVDKKLGRGRPRVDSEIVTARVGRAVLDALDAWRGRQPEPKPTRPEAVRAALKDWLAREGLLSDDAHNDASKT